MLSPGGRSLAEFVFDAGSRVGKEALYAASSAQCLQAFYKEDVASAKQVQTELENFQDVSVRFLLMLYLCLVKLVNKIKL